MQESDFNEIMGNLRSQKHRLADFDIYLTSRDSRTGIQSVSMGLSGHTCSTENTCMRYNRRIYLEIVSALAMIIISTLILSSCTCYVCILPPGTSNTHFWVCVLFENDRNRYPTKKYNRDRPISIMDWIWLTGPFRPVFQIFPICI